MLHHRLALLLTLFALLCDKLAAYNCLNATNCEGGCALGYAGSSCDSCAADFYGYPACQPCPASNSGDVCSSAGRCHSWSGICLCSPKLAGPLCSEAAVCGNGIVESGEACDSHSSSCSSCQLTSGTYCLQSMASSQRIINNRTVTTQSTSTLSCGDLSKTLPQVSFGLTQPNATGIVLDASFLLGARVIPLVVQPSANRTSSSASLSVKILSFNSLSSAEQASADTTSAVYSSVAFSLALTPAAGYQPSNPLSISIDFGATLSGKCPVLSLYRFNTSTSLWSRASLLCPASSSFESLSSSCVLTVNLCYWSGDFALFHFPSGDVATSISSDYHTVGIIIGATLFFLAIIAVIYVIKNHVWPSDAKKKFSFGKSVDRTRSRSRLASVDRKRTRHGSRSASRSSLNEEKKTPGPRSAKLSPRRLEMTPLAPSHSEVAVSASPAPSETEHFPTLASLIKPKITSVVDRTATPPPSRPDELKSSPAAQYRPRQFVEQVV